MKAVWFVRLDFQKLRKLHLLSLFSLDENMTKMHRTLDRNSKLLKINLKIIKQMFVVSTYIPEIEDDMKLKTG